LLSLQEREKLTIRFRVLLKGIPLSLHIDGATINFDHGAHMVNILAVTPLLDEPVLLAASVVHVALDAKKLSELILECIHHFGIEHKNVVCVSSDNTAVMPAAIRKCGFEFAPCIAHVFNLCAKAMTFEFDIGDRLGFALFLTNKRVSELHDANLVHANRLSVPEHRFSYILPFLIELRANYDGYREFVRNYKEVGVDARTGAAYFPDFKDKLCGPKSARYRVYIEALFQLVKPLCELLKLVEAGVNRSHLDFHTEFLVIRKRLLDTHANTEAYIDKNLVPLFPQAFADKTLGMNPKTIYEDVKNRIECACEAAVALIIKHIVGAVGDHPLADEILAGLEQPDSDAVKLSLLPIFQRAFGWSSVKDLPGPSNTKALEAMLGQYPPADWLDAYGVFFEHLQSRRLPATAMRVLEAHEFSPRAFWAALFKHGMPAYHTVAWSALAALSIPLSNATAERSFSVLRHISSYNRLLAGESYTSNVMFLAGNQAHLTRLYAPRIEYILATLPD
jgi:hypothetical protein